MRPIIRSTIDNTTITKSKRFQLSEKYTFRKTKTLESISIVNTAVQSRSTTSKVLLSTTSSA